jgi:hypothetical protein
VLWVAALNCTKIKHDGAAASCTEHPTLELPAIRAQEGSMERYRFVRPHVPHESDHGGNTNLPEL